MKYSRTVGCVNIQLNTKRIDENLRRAQDKLDMQVQADMIQYMPRQQGYLIASTNIVEPGLIRTEGPYAHYQYMGELYLTEDGRSFANKGERKYPTGRPLHYNTPGTSDHWFERAKETHGRQWIDLVKREAGRG
nr:MAG TPA: Minor capsid protein [Caudoviricetes sp.]